MQQPGVHEEQEVSHSCCKTLMQMTHRATSTERIPDRVLDTDCLRFARSCTAETESCSTAAYAMNAAPSPKGFSCPTGTQFPVPFPYGYGQQVWNLVPGPKTGAAADVWVIVDHVRAPAQAGEFVLRWRWDVEQNPQIWTHCADILVK